MAAKEHAALIGMTAQWAIPSYDGIKVPVTITNVREAYGRIDYEVAIRGGSGSVWIDASRVRLDGK